MSKIGDMVVAAWNASKNNPRKVFLDVMYVTGTFIGSTLIASNTGNNILGFWAYLVASAAGITLVHMSNASRSLLLVGYYYVIVNIVGIYRHTI